VKPHKSHCMLGNFGHKHTQNKYVPTISFPLQQWSRERSSLLRYTYIACLVNLFAQ